MSENEPVAIDSREPGTDSDALADELLDMCRALVAITAQSVAAVSDTVDLIELRVLVVVSSKQTASLRDVADAVGLHTSTASRLCDRMVARELLDRRDDPADRRQLQLTLAPDGAAVVRMMLRRRRAAVRRAVARVPAERREPIRLALGEFTSALDAHDERDLWALAWTS